MKGTKFLATAVLLVLLFSSLFTGDMKRVSAEGGGAKLEMSSTEGYTGDTVSVTVSLMENPGIAGMGVWVCYDSASLRVMDVVLSEDVFVEDLAECQKAGDGYVGYAAAGSRDNAKTGQLFTIQFEIIQGTVTGDIALTYSGSNGAPEASNAEGNTVELSLVTGKVSVLCRHENTTSSEVPATCTEAGSRTTVCGDCGQVVETETIAALGHTLEEYTVTKEATCTETGIETAKCSRCGEASTREIAALGHAYGNLTVTKEETETETGEITATCAVDDAKATWTIPVIQKNDFQASVLTEEGKELDTAEFTEGTRVSFTASVQGANKEVAEAGDVRYIPVSWNFMQESGKMSVSDGRYSAAVLMDKSGDYTLEVVYDRQMYNGTEWVTYGTYTCALAVHVAEKAQNNSGSQEEESSVDVPAASSNSEIASPKTGEAEGNITVITAAALLGISCILAVCARKKKKVK